MRQTSIAAKRNMEGFPGRKGSGQTFNERQARVPRETTASRGGVLKKKSLWLLKAGGWETAPRSTVGADCQSPRHRAPWCLPTALNTNSTQNPAHGCLEQLYSLLSKLGAEMSFSGWVDKLPIQTEGRKEHYRDELSATERHAGTSSACY